MKCINCRWVAVLRVCSRQFDRPAVRWCFFFWCFYPWRVSGIILQQQVTLARRADSHELGFFVKGWCGRIAKTGGLRFQAALFWCQRGCWVGDSKLAAKKWCLIALPRLIVVPLRTVRLLFAAAGKDYEARFPYLTDEIDVFAQGPSSKVIWSP